MKRLGFYHQMAKLCSNDLKWQTVRMVVRKKIKEESFSEQPSGQCFFECRQRNDDDFWHHILKCGKRIFTTTEGLP